MRRGFWGASWGGSVCVGAFGARSLVVAFKRLPLGSARVIALIGNGPKYLESPTDGPVGCRDATDLVEYAYFQESWWLAMPVCPFCRKSVELNSVWCSCGVNLSRFPALPKGADEVREWLVRHVPDTLETTLDSASALLKQARKQLLDNQDSEVLAETKHTAEVTEVQKLISTFLEECLGAGLVPTVDIGQLRRDRWKQWKRIPVEYKQNAPLKVFKLSPGFIFEVNVAKFKDEFCLGLDGSIYKHQLNAVDPFPIDELLKIATVDKIAESLLAALVWLLKAKQQPDLGAEPVAKSKETVEAAPGSNQAPTLKTGGFKLPFGRKNGAEEADGIVEQAFDEPITEGDEAEEEPIEVKPTA